MGATYLAAAAVLCASALIGQAIYALLGRRRWSWLAPAVGFACLLALGGVLVHVPGHPIPLAVGGAVAMVAALASRRTRQAVVEALPEGLLVAVPVLAAASLPFLVSGHAGILGVAKNTDMSAHLTAAFWLQTHHGPEPVAAAGELLVGQGYPFGPQGLVAVLAAATGMSALHAFDGLTIAIPALTALSALAVLSDGPFWGRPLAAGVVGLCYLAASYLAQGAFKETIAALLVLAFALALREVVLAERRPQVGDGVPLGLLAAGLVYTYSYVGLVWPAAILAVVGLVLALRLVLRPSLVRSRAAAGVVVRLGLGALVAGLVAVSVELGRVLTFHGSHFAHEPAEGTGNLYRPIPVVQALSVWLRSDYRFDTKHPQVAHALIVVALIALAFALVSLARRDVVIPLALAAAALVYWQVSGHRNIYNAAKALAVLAPLAALTSAAPLLAAWRRGTGRDRWAVRGGRALVRVVGVVVLLGAAASSMFVLRDAYVGASAQASDLERLRPLLGDQPTLLLDFDTYAHWHLRGATVATAPVMYPTFPVRPRGAKPLALAAPIDFDNFKPTTLDQFRYVITTTTPYRSAPPSNFRLVRRTRWYELWERHGTTPWRIPYERHESRPGAYMDCASARGQQLLGQRGVAAFVARPVLTGQRHWQGQPRRVGDVATQVVTLPAGTWDLSLQYMSVTGLDVSAGDLHTAMSPSLTGFGSFWLVGTVHQPRSGPLTVRVRARPTGWLGRLLGAPGYTRAIGSPHFKPLDKLVLTRHHARDHVVPLQEACGRYVDWYQLEG